MNKHLTHFKNTISSLFKSNDIKIFVYSSRTQLDNYKHIDTAILKEKMEENNIPFKIDIIDHTVVKGSYVNEVLKK